MANLIDFDHSRENIIGFVVEGFAPIDLEIPRLNADMKDQGLRFGLQTKCRNKTAQACSEVRTQYCTSRKLDPKKLSEAQEAEVRKMQRPVAHAGLQGVISQLYDGKWIGPREGGGFRDLSVANDYDFDLLAQAIFTVHKPKNGLDKVRARLTELDKPQKEGGDRQKIRDYAKGGKVPEVYAKLAAEKGIKVATLNPAEDF